MEEVFVENLGDKIKKILSNLDLELNLESPDENFTFVYSTNIVAQEIENPTDLIRNYRLYQKNNGSDINAPWDEYDEAKQITLITNLIKYAKYRIKGIYSGWQLNCPHCKTKIEGKIWRNNPKRCKGIETIICNYIFNDSDKEMIISELFKKDTS